MTYWRPSLVCSTWYFGCFAILPPAFCDQGLVHHDGCMFATNTATLSPANEGRVGGADAIPTTHRTGKGEFAPLAKDANVSPRGMWRGLMFILVDSKARKLPLWQKVIWGMFLVPLYFGAVLLTIHIKVRK
jgi:hypothetical protein